MKNSDSNEEVKTTASNKGYYSRIQSPLAMKDSFDVALEAIRAGEILLKVGSGGKPVEPTRVIEKGVSDYQTDLDISIQKRVTEIIRTYFETDGIVSEENYTRNRRSDRVWYLDPVDGTRNLMDGRPDIAISLALYERGIPRLGIISMPCRGLRVGADRNQNGLLLNGSMKHLKPRRRILSQSLVAIPGDFPKNPETTRPLLRLVRLLGKEGEGLRITGALAYDLGCLALREIDVRISLAPKAVDTAAGAFIVSHSGGIVTNIGGDPWSLDSGTILATSSQKLHTAVLKVITR